MLNYLASLVCIIIFLGVVILVVRTWHQSYLEYVNCFLINEDRKILKKLWRLFRAYFVLGGILAVALALIKTDFDVVAAQNYFYIYFLSSCFFLFIARTYTTTKLIGTKPNVKRIMRHMNHINFLAFFGMVTGILDVLISVTQSSEIRTRLFESTFVVEFGISENLVPVLPFIGGTMAIPFLFSALELFLIWNRNKTM